jgi:hypothetical protein
MIHFVSPSIITEEVFVNEGMTFLFTLYFSDLCFKMTLKKRKAYIPTEKHQRYFSVFLLENHNDQRVILKWTRAKIKVSPSQVLYSSSTPIPEILWCSRLLRFQFK